MKQKWSAWLYLSWIKRRNMLLWTSAEEIKSVPVCKKWTSLLFFCCVGLCFLILAVSQPTAAAEVWFLPLSWRAYVNQSSFHALFTAAETGLRSWCLHRRNTVLHSHCCLLGSSSGRTHTHTQSWGPFICPGEAGNCSSCLAIHLVLFFSRLSHKEVTQFFFSPVAEEDLDGIKRNLRDTCTGWWT